MHTFPKDCQGGLSAPVRFFSPPPAFLLPFLLFRTKELDKALRETEKAIERNNHYLGIYKSVKQGEEDLQKNEKQKEKLALKLLECRAMLGEQEEQEPERKALLEKITIKRENSQIMVVSLYRFFRFPKRFIQFLCPSVQILTQFLQHFPQAVIGSKLLFRLHLFNLCGAYLFI